MISASERRRAQRFPLALPFEVKSRADAGESRFPADLRDISASGVYFSVDRQLQPESRVEFFVQLRIEGAPAEGVLLHCVGSIVRVEPKGGDLGVAARIDRYRFVRPGEESVGVESQQEE